MRNLYWLVIEDAQVLNPLVTRQLQRIGVPFEHLVGEFEQKKIFFKYFLRNKKQQLCEHPSKKLK